MDGDYGPDAPRLSVDFGGDWGRASFVRVCVHCGRFVAPLWPMSVQSTQDSVTPNATCARCGAVQMLFEGFL